MLAKEQNVLRVPPEEIVFIERMCLVVFVLVPGLIIGRAHLKIKKGQRRQQSFLFSKSLRGF